VPEVVGAKCPECGGPNPNGEACRGGCETKPSAPVGRADDEVGFYLRCHEASGHFTPWSKLAPSERLAWQAAFAAGSASSVSRERVRYVAERVGRLARDPGGATLGRATLLAIESELRRLCDAE
jgi:hypothetical protein